ncbi:VanZ family protein [Piscibacillus sp. B03]|uniref:VanZ family protein n=1 Tax=Piscibacillus sp. B03 TaxID=3457430 RepID=UPI003FCED644
MLTILSWIFVVLWMMLIFYLSHQPAKSSQKLSSSVTDAVFGRHKGTKMSQLHHYIRKGAHFFVYFVLGVLIMIALLVSGWSDLNAVGITFVVCSIYAMSDEFHQRFVPGRGAQVSDVLIDVAGASLGILLVALFVVL